MRRHCAVLLPLLAACAPRVHPLQGELDALHALEAAPAPAHWQPTATIALSSPMRDQLFGLATDAAQAAVPERIDMNVPMMGDVGLLPELQRPEFKLRTSDKCTGCTRIDLGWDGRLRMIRGRKEDVFRLSSDVVVTAQLRLQRAEAGQQLVAQVLPDGPHGARVQIPTIPSMMAPMVNGALTAELEHQLNDGGLGEPVLVATLPSAKGVALRDVRVDVNPALGVSALFLAEGQTPVPVLPAPADGWEVRLTDATALGVLRSVAAHQPLVYNFAVEPTALNVADDRFDAELRLRKAIKRERYRDYHVSGQLVVSRDHKLRVTGLTLDERGGHGHIMGFVRHRFEKALRGTLAASVPAQWPFELGEQKGTVRATSVRLQDGLIVIAGELAVVQPPPARGR